MTVLVFYLSNTGDSNGRYEPTVRTVRRYHTACRLAVPRQDGMSKLGMAHNAPTAIHPRGSQMSRQIRRRHYWPQMHRDCEQFASECLVCQRAAAAPHTGQDQVQYVPVGKPLSVVAIDIVGPLGNGRTATSQGNRYIVTMVDWFSRFICMYAVPEPTAEQVGKCLTRFVARFGAPLTLLSDNANYFKDRAIREWERQLGIKHAFVSAHRPAGNGLLERFHRTLGRALKTGCKMPAILIGMKGWTCWR